MSQDYFSSWTECSGEQSDLAKLKQALKDQDKAQVELLGERIFDSYFDVAAALELDEARQYAALLGAELEGESIEICVYELLDHEHPDHIDQAFSHSAELGIEVDYREFMLYDLESVEAFLPERVEGVFHILNRKGKMSYSDYFGIVSSALENVRFGTGAAEYLKTLLERPEMDISSLSDDDFAAAVFACVVGEHFVPGLFALFVSKAGGRSIAEDSEWLSIIPEYEGVNETLSEFGIVEPFVLLKQSHFIPDHQAFIESLEESVPELAETYANA